MKYITLQLETNNAAFDDDMRASEVSRIILNAASRILDDGDCNFDLSDINGNTVGFLAKSRYKPELDEGCDVFLYIKTGNAAFEDDQNYEVARILKVAANKFEQGHTEMKLVDYNGNTVGDAYMLTDDDHGHKPTHNY